ncbi:MAG: hypothetical protein PWP03_132 [Candidatus Woesearchaeota archaeon]|nr:hypothetical protein [Candidatus Woesearchaeota archaeon]MDN5327494.1 hypothetical protein [Candidatus Woesearchaeota archaeon]
MNKWGLLVVSLLLLIVGIGGIVYWFNDFLTFLKGGIGLVLALLGALLLIVAIEEFKY